MSSAVRVGLVPMKLLDDPFAVTGVAARGFDRRSGVELALALCNYTEGPWEAPL